MDRIRDIRAYGRAPARDIAARPRRLLPIGLIRGVALALALAAAGCAGLDSAAPPSSLQSILRSRPAANAETARLLAFYEARNFRPAWTGGAEAEARAVSVRTVLARADEQGLRSEDYATKPGDGTGMDYEIALTSAVLRYAGDVRTGRVRPSDLYKDVGLPAADFDAGAALERALRNDSVTAFLAELPPPHPEYRRLAAALAHYREIDGEGGWGSLPSTGEIKLEGNDARRKLLIERLAAEDAELGATPNAATLRDAVKRFQLRNGLDADGLVGPNTLKALNVPASSRVKQIAANMERWRWLPRQFERRYIAVDVPDQSLKFVQNGDIALTSRVIVGTTKTTTPILRTMVNAVVASPPWNVPGDIAARDFLPKLRLDPAYLESRNMVVAEAPKGDPHGKTIKWRDVKYEEFFYHVRELPGPNSALGQLMLDMPNDFDVYLHDTPGKALFEEDERTISNGCIRVQEIFALASLALEGDAEEGLPALRKATASRETQRLALDNPLPVYLLYWTAVASADGTVGFRPDRYSRDEPLIAALN